MTIEEIRANAPSGATHYAIKRVFEGCYYFKAVGNNCYIWTIFKRWQETPRKFNEYDDIKPL